VGLRKRCEIQTPLRQVKDKVKRERGRLARFMESFLCCSVSIGTRNVWHRLRGAVVSWRRRRSPRSLRPPATVYQPFGLKSMVHGKVCFPFLSMHWGHERVALAGLETSVWFGYLGLRSASPQAITLRAFSLGTREGTDSVYSYLRCLASRMSKNEATRA
jgi:hypothetical protein